VRKIVEHKKNSHDVMNVRLHTLQCWSTLTDRQTMKQCCRQMHWNTDSNADVQHKCQPYKWH